MYMYIYCFKAQSLIWNLLRLPISVSKKWFSDVPTCRGSWGPECKRSHRQWRWSNTGRSCTRHCRTANTAARNRWPWTGYKIWRTADQPRRGWWWGCSWSTSFQDSPPPPRPPANSRRDRECRSCRRIMAPPPPLFVLPVHGRIRIRISRRPRVHSRARRIASCSWHACYRSRLRNSRPPIPYLAQERSTIFRLDQCMDSVWITLRQIY